LKKLFNVWGLVKNIFDRRDVFVFGGLILMGYGLYLFKPWVSYVVIGAVLLWIGLFLGKKKAA
jgi:uncharacterized membrane protein